MEYSKDRRTFALVITASALGAMALAGTLLAVVLTAGGAL